MATATSDPEFTPRHLLCRSKARSDLGTAMAIHSRSDIRRGLGLLDEEAASRGRGADRPMER